MQNKDIKIIFMGSAEFSVPILLNLIKSFNVIAVITEIDKPAGRGKEIIAPPTKKLSLQHDIPCYQPLTVTKNPKLLDKIADLEPDLLVVAAYGKILPEEILNIPAHGCLNVHPSILPKYRGSSPIQTALHNGDKKTGVSVILMDKEMDAGDLVDVQDIAIKSEENYITLSKRLSLISAESLVRIIPKFVLDQLTLETQNDGEATYCSKIKKSDGRTDWTESATEIANQIRAYAEWPGTYTFWGKQKLDILSAQAMDMESDAEIGQVFKNKKDIYVKCQSGCLLLGEIKLEGKKKTLARDFVNGHQDFLGAMLG